MGLVGSRSSASGHHQVSHATLRVTSNSDAPWLGLVFREARARLLANHSYRETPPCAIQQLKPVAADILWPKLTLSQSVIHSL
eukprot:352422-Chlamydomonas_euryale.AAC.5